MLGFVPQPNLQATVINKHLNDAMLCLLASPIFYERIKFCFYKKIAFYEPYCA